jgi:hypothetical protein
MNIAYIRYFIHNNSRHRTPISLVVKGSLEESSFDTRTCDIRDVFGNCAQLAPVLVLFTSRILGKHVHLGFYQVWYQGIVTATVSGVLEDLTFKISEGSDQD